MSRRLEGYRSIIARNIDLSTGPYTRGFFCGVFWEFLNGCKQLPVKVAEAIKIKKEEVKEEETNK